MRNSRRVRVSRLTCGAVIAALLGLFPAIAAAQVSTIQVPSAAAPDIQTAINQAAAIVTGATPTDVVIDVAPGTYIPSVQLDVSGITSTAFTVTLRAARGPSRTTIDLSNVDGLVMFGDGVRNLVIDGFTVRNRIPNENVFTGGGIWFRNAGSVTVVNCHLDTTDVAIRFGVRDPALSAEYRVVNNTILAGQGSDPNSPDTTFGAGVNMRTAYAPGTVPTGEIKLIVTSNVIRTNENPVRFINLATDGVGLFGNGSVIVTGNDMSSIFGSAVQMRGGHGHIVAENHAHDSANGFLIRSTSGVIENNLIVNDHGHGIIASNDGLPTQGFTAEQGVFIRHNTITDNDGTGIIYIDTIGTRDFLPNVYNNIVAFNHASGFASVVQTINAFAFIPVSFNLASNDVFGNTLKNINFAFVDFNYLGISNPQAEDPNYTGVINTGLDLAKNPEFTSAQTGDFTLSSGSPLINAGLTTRPTPFQDLALHLRDTLPDIGAYEFEQNPASHTSSSADAAITATESGTKRKVRIE
jgi:copper-binding protein NosD